MLGSLPPLAALPHRGGFPEVDIGTVVQHFGPFDIGNADLAVVHFAGAKVCFVRFVTAQT